MKKYVEIESRGLILSGVIHIPDYDAKSFPLVCLFHGLGGNKTETHFMFAKLSKLMEKNGIASARFDFGGSGESEGEFSSVTVSSELEDAKTILDYVKNLDFVDCNRVGVLGYSLGGLVSLLLSDERRSDFEALCLWCPALNIYDVAVSGKSAVDLQKMETEGYIDLNGLALSKSFLDDIEKHDVFSRGNQFRKAILVIHGEEDSIVPIVNSERLVGRLGDLAVLDSIRSANHEFDNLVLEQEVLIRSLEFFRMKL